MAEIKSDSWWLGLLVTSVLMVGVTAASLSNRLPALAEAAPDCARKLADHRELDRTEFLRDLTATEERERLDIEVYVRDHCPNPVPME